MVGALPILEFLMSLQDLGFGPFQLFLSFSLTMPNFQVQNVLLINNTNNLPCFSISQKSSFSRIVFNSWFLPSVEPPVAQYALNFFLLSDSSFFSGLEFVGTYSNSSLLNLKHGKSMKILVLTMKDR